MASLDVVKTSTLAAGSRGPVGEGVAEVILNSKTLPVLLNGSGWKVMFTRQPQLWSGSFIMRAAEKKRAFYSPSFVDIE